MNRDLPRNSLIWHAAWDVSTIQNWQFTIDINREVHHAINPHPNPTMLFVFQPSWLLDMQQSIIKLLYFNSWVASLFNSIGAGIIIVEYFRTYRHDHRLEPCNSPLPGQTKDNNYRESKSHGQRKRRTNLATTQNDSHHIPDQLRHREHHEDTNHSSAI